MPRPTTPTNDIGEPQMTAVLDLIEQGSDISKACRDANVNRVTFYYKLKRMPDAKARFDRITNNSSKVIRPGNKSKKDAPPDYAALVKQAFTVIAESMKPNSKYTEAQGRLALTTINQFKEHIKSHDEKIVDLRDLYDRFPGFEDYMSNKSLADQILKELKSAPVKVGDDEITIPDAKPDTNNYSGMSLADRLSVQGHQFSAPEDDKEEPDHEEPKRPVPTGDQSGVSAPDDYNPPELEGP